MRAEKPQRTICGAKTRKGTICQRPPMVNGKCHLHGGKSLAGIASTQWKTGKYSKYLPGRLMARYEEALNDPELISLSGEIALVDTRIGELLTRIDTGESGQHWKDANKYFADATEAIRQNDTKAHQVAMLSLRDVLQVGQRDFYVWGEIVGLLEARRRLVDTERRRLVDAEQMITANEAMSLVAALMVVIKQHVADRDTLIAISDAFIRLTARPDRFIAAR